MPKNLTKGEKTVILISGKMRSGKDTIAKILLERLKSDKTNPVIMHFSDPMKFIISKTLDIPYDNLNSLKNNNEEIHISGKLTNDVTLNVYTNMRRILQQFGTDAMQTAFGKDIWVSLMQKKIENDNEHNIFIIPDFRFKHEYFKNPYRNWYTTDNTNFITIKVKSDLKSSIINENHHISEHDLDNFTFDIEIDNPKSITGISDKVYSDCANIVNEILKLY